MGIKGQLPGKGNAKLPWWPASFRAPDKANRPPEEACITVWPIEGGRHGRYCTRVQWPPLRQINPPSTQPLTEIRLPDSSSRDMYSLSRSGA